MYKRPNLPLMLELNMNREESKNRNELLMSEKTIQDSLLGRLEETAAFSNLTILEDLSYALFHNEVYGINSWYVDLTEGTVISLPSDYERIYLNDELSLTEQLENDFIKKHVGHELIEIIPVRSHISFEIMKDFAETCTEKQRTVLLTALCKTHPFSLFRQAVERMGVLQNWYDFKNKEELHFAEKWLKVENLFVQDGKIVKENL